MRDLEGMKDYLDEAQVDVDSRVPAVDIKDRALVRGLIRHHRSVLAEVESLRAKLAAVETLLSELDLNSPTTAPGTAWGLILREALATARSQEPPTGGQ